MVMQAFEAIGTQWRLDLYQPGPDSVAALAAVRRRIAAFDRTYSRFRPDSLVSAMAQTAGRYTLPPDAPPLLRAYRRLYELTAGAMTPLIGQVLSDAGYDAAYSLQEHTLAQPPAWDDVLAWDGGITLTLTAPALLDVGAAGKGYLVDLVAAELESHGVSAYTVDAGGDIYHHAPSGPPLRVGLEHPVDPSQAVGVVELTTGALCGSAGNRRRWGRFHHIIDPRSLTSPRHLAAVWVAADTALVADALATALFFVPPATLKPDFTFEYVIVAADGSAQYSPDFPGELFSA